MRSPLVGGTALTGQSPRLLSACGRVWCGEWVGLDAFQGLWEAAARPERRAVSLGPAGSSLASAVARSPGAAAAAKPRQYVPLTPRLGSSDAHGLAGAPLAPDDDERASRARPDVGVSCVREALPLGGILGTECGFKKCNGSGAREVQLRRKKRGALRVLPRFPFLGSRGRPIDGARRPSSASSLPGPCASMLVPPRRWCDLQASRY